MYRWSRAARLYDGPDEVHKVTARRVLREYEPHDLPTEHVPTRREAAIAKFGPLLDGAVAPTAQNATVSRHRALVSGASRGIWPGGGTSPEPGGARRSCLLALAERLGGDRRQG